MVFKGDRNLNPDASDLPLQHALVAYDSALARGLNRVEALEASTQVSCDHEEFAALRTMLDLLESVWPRSSASAKDDSEEGSPYLPAGTQIGRFHIIRQLGHGGFGVVYLAEDPHLRRHVALKLPRPEVLFTHDLRRRFMREARVAGSLNHPHILPVFESGELGNICYLVSPYCSNGSLNDLLVRQEQPFNPRQAARLILQLAEATHYAHQQGILHRDLKPGNILIEENDDSSARGTDTLDFRARIGDFGLAQFVEADAKASLENSLHSLATKPGAMLGTPRYMAPEQVNGDVAGIGPPTDVYGLGGILYRMLTGRPPFSADNCLDLLQQVVSREPLAPRHLRPEIPRDLEAICLKCLEKRPAKRYRSARDLADDVSRFLRREPTQARPLSPLQRIARRSRQHPVAAGGTLAAICLGIMIVVGLTFHSIRVQRYATLLEDSLDRETRLAHAASRARDVAEKRERTAQQEAYVSVIARGLRMVQSGQQSGLCELLNRHPSTADDSLYRGFEWHYLWSLGFPRSRLRGPLYSYDYIRFSPRGNYCLTWSGVSEFVPSLGDEKSPTIQADDPHLYVWDVPGRRLHGKLRCDSAPLAATFTPDEKEIISISDVGLLQSWDIQGRERLHSESGPSLTPYVHRPYSSAEFAPNSKILAYTSVVTVNGMPVNSLRLLDLETKATWELPLDSAIARVIRFSTDNQWMAVYANSYDDGRNLQVYSVSRAEEIAKFSKAVAKKVELEELPTFHDMSFLNGTSQLIIGTKNGLVLNWNFETDDCSRLQVSSPQANVSVTSGFASGEIIASARDPARTDSIFQIGNDGMVRTIPISDAVGSDRIVSSPDKKTIAFGGYFGHFSIWEYSADKQPFQTLGKHEGEAWGAGISPDGKSLVTGGDDHLVRIWDLKTSQLRSTIRGHTSLVSACDFSPNGRLVASAGFDSKVRVWNSATGKRVRTLTGHRGDIRTLCFLSDEHLITGGADAQVRVWDVKSGRQKKAMSGHTNKIRAVVVDRKRGTFVTADNSGAIKRWQSNNLQLLGSRLDDSEIQSLALTRDGTKLAAGSRDGTIWIYSMPEMEVLETLASSAGAARALVFSADGRTLATGGEDKAITLWHVATGQQMMTLPGVESIVNSLVFSPDGRTLAAATHDGRITLWKSGQRD